MLKASVGKYFHPRATEPALSGCNVELGAGSIAAIVGPSGIGKTTLLTVLCGVAPGRMEGSCTYTTHEGVFSPQSAARKGLFGYAAQETTLLPWLTIEDNLFLPFRLNNRLEPKRRDSFELLDSVGLSKHVLKRHPHVLSGGMRQRVSIVRALLYEPSFVFLDEVFSGLDSGSAQMVDHVLRDYFASKEAVCVLVTHDIERTYGLATHRFLLTQHGTLVDTSAGTADELTSLLEQEQRSLIRKSFDPQREAA